LGVCVDGGNNVYVADFNNHRVQKFASDGAFLMKWGTYGTGDGQFRNPSGIAADAMGNLYVVDGSNHRIQVFASDGTFLTAWGTQDAGDGGFYYPFGIAVDASGGVYVADTGHYRIQKFGQCAISAIEPEIGRPRLHLAPPVPNPWSGRTALGFTLARAGRASIAVYDVHGRLMKRWFWPSLPPGSHQVTWDGRMDDGEPTSNGVLFYRVEANGQTLTQKMVHIR
jgi:DNA-binding beta-propeller fold protein YncE